MRVAWAMWTSTPLYITHPPTWSDDQTWSSDQLAAECRPIHSTGSQLSGPPKKGTSSSCLEIFLPKKFSPTPPWGCWGVTEARRDTTDGVSGSQELTEASQELNSTASASSRSKPILDSSAHHILAFLSLLSFPYVCHKKRTGVWIEIKTYCKQKQRSLFCK